MQSRSRMTRTTVFCAGPLRARPLLTEGVELSALEHFVSRLVDEERFWDSPVDFALVTVEYPSLKPLELMKKDIPRGKLQEYLMASAACFPAFQTKEIDGRRYMDGGYHDNMPVNLALTDGGGPGDRGRSGIDRHYPSGPRPGEAGDADLQPVAARLLFEV